MARASLDYSGMDKLMGDIIKAGGNIEEAAKDALKITHKHVTGKIEKAMPKHTINDKPVDWDHTGETKESLIKEADIEFSNGVGQVVAGFDFPGAASYLIRGTPRMQPDPKLEQAMGGKNVRRQVHELQEEAFEDYLSEILGE